MRSVCKSAFRPFCLFCLLFLLSVPSVLPAGSFRQPVRYMQPASTVSALDVGSPYAWWRIDSTDSGSTLADNGTGGGALTNIGSVALSNMSPYSVKFSGAGTDYLAAGALSAFIHATNVAVSLWVKPVATSRGDYIGSWQTTDSSSKFIILRGVTASKFSCYFITWQGSFSSVTTTNDFLTNTWYHLVWNSSGPLSGTLNTNALWVNGALNNSIAGYGCWSNATIPFLVGKNNNGNPCNDYIDDIRLFTNGLSATQITNLYLQGRQ